MKLGIVSDSHDSKRGIEQAVDAFRREQVDRVLHCGDIVSPFSAKVFAERFGGGFTAVMGNNDGETLGLKKAVTSNGGQIHQTCYKGKLAGKRVFMTHMPDTLDEVVASEMYDLVLYGHTHKVDVRQVGPTLVINPGESTTWLSGAAHIAVVDLADMSHRLVQI